MTQLPIFVWGDTKNRVYVKASGGMNTQHPIRLLPPDNYSPGTPMELVWVWKAEKPGLVKWMVEVGVLPASLETQPVSLEESQRWMEEFNRLEPPGTQSISLEENARADVEYVGRARGIKLPKDKGWYFCISRLGAEDAGENVRIAPIFLEYGEQ